jgi:DNA-binding transcriptional regulator LsrR (DeoR family)
MARTPDRRPVDRLFSEKSIDARLKTEVISLACRLFMEGKTADQMQGELKSKKYARYTKHFKREDSWRLIRKAVQDGWFEFKPPLEFELAAWLARAYSWKEDQVTVVASPHLDDVASRAASKLLDLIRTYRKFKQDPVNIGFAGGRTLRRVAERLAQLLCKPSRENPKKIVFHAMVAAFDEEHFESDPNNFISYFIDEPVTVDVASIRMPTPGFVETDLCDQLRKFEAIRHVYEKAKDINIIVTGGGSWLDKHSVLRSYMSEIRKPDVETLEELKTLGDLLWQPMSSTGPVPMDPKRLAFRANTLLELAELPGLIENNVRVMLVLGACPECGEPHGELLDAILGARPPLITDVITDVSNVHDLVLKANHANG